MVGRGAEAEELVADGVLEDEGALVAEILPVDADAGAQADEFFFNLGYDNDTIIGFGDDQDTLILTTALVGNITANDALTNFATEVSGGVNFDFGNGLDFLRITSMTKAQLEDDILIIM